MKRERNCNDTLEMEQMDLSKERQLPTRRIWYPPGHYYSCDGCGQRQNDQHNWSRMRCYDTWGEFRVTYLCLACYESSHEYEYSAACWPVPRGEHPWWPTPVRLTDSCENADSNVSNAACASERSVASTGPADVETVS